MPLTDPVGRQTEGKGACPLFPLNFNRTHWRGEGKLLSLNCEFNPLTPRFHYASGFVSLILAYMLDSLVRVSRRVEENHFAHSANPATDDPKWYSPFVQAELCSPTH